MFRIMTPLIKQRTKMIIYAQAFNSEVSEMHLPIFQFAQEVVFEGNVSTMLTCTRNGHDVRDI